MELVNGIKCLKKRFRKVESKKPLGLRSVWPQTSRNELASGALLADGTAEMKNSNIFRYINSAFFSQNLLKLGPNASLYYS